MIRALLAAGAVLSACAPAPPGPPEDPVAFRCEDGGALSVLFREGTATVTARQGTFVLPQQRAASGFWYSNGRYGLRGKADAARWEVGRMAPVVCRASEP